MQHQSSATVLEVAIAPKLAALFMQNSALGKSIASFKFT